MRCQSHKITFSVEALYGTIRQREHTEKETGCCPFSLERKSEKERERERESLFAKKSAAFYNLKPAIGQLCISYCLLHKTSHSGMTHLFVTVLFRVTFLETFRKKVLVLTHI